jgi:hypothetical protein
MQVVAENRFGIFYYEMLFPLVGNLFEKKKDSGQARMTEKRE